MNQYIQAITSYVTEHKKDFAIGGGIVIGIVVLVAAVLFINHNINRPAKIIYQPAKACALLTLDEAKKLLGDATLNTNNGEPVLSGNTVTSRCGYTDGNPDMNTMIVAAIIVRSGINDKGVQQNTTEYNSNISAEGTVKVANLGDKAYFNQSIGQLNILDGRKWMILSYGVGADPLSNTEEKATELARIVLE